MIQPHTTWQIYTDGGSRGNPGLSAGAFVVYKQSQLIFEQGEFFGIKTNNEAEYLAVLASLNWLKTQPSLPSSATWYLDSKLVVEQISLRWRIKHPHLLPLHHSCLQLLKKIFPQKTFTFTHIPRCQNARADELLNQILNKNSRS
jgi:ribonuclease HI